MMTPRGGELTLFFYCPGVLGALFAGIRESGKRGRWTEGELRPFGACSHCDLTAYCVRGHFTTPLHGILSSIVDFCRNGWD